MEKAVMLVIWIVISQTKSVQSRYGRSQQQAGARLAFSARAAVSFCACQRRCDLKRSARVQHSIVVDQLDIARFHHHVDAHFRGHHHLIKQVEGGNLRIGKRVFHLLTAKLDILPQIPATELAVMKAENR